MRIAVALLFIIHVFASSASAGEFVPGTAINDAAKISDQDKQTFQVMVIPAGSHVGATAALLTQKLLAAAKARANLAVIGPDPNLTASAVVLALQIAADDSLIGATILYVGDTEYTEELQTAALPTGATVRTSQYSGK